MTQLRDNGAKPVMSKGAIQRRIKQIGSGSGRRKSDSREDYRLDSNPNRMPASVPRPYQWSAEQLAGNPKR